MKSHLFILIVLNIFIVITITGCGGNEESVANESSAQGQVKGTVNNFETKVTEPTVITNELISALYFDLLSSTELNVTLPA